MSLSLGLFDVFTHMVPGSLYLSVLLFVTDSLHLVRVDSFAGAPSVVLIADLLIASYLLGWAAEPMAEMLNRAVQFRAARNDIVARKEFADRVRAQQAARSFKQISTCSSPLRKYTLRTRLRR